VRIKRFSAWTYFYLSSSFAIEVEQGIEGLVKGSTGAKKGGEEREDKENEPPPPFFLCL
jgi:hypothetical protein